MARKDDGARGIVEMLFCTSLIALVGAADQPQSSPRKLQIVNTKASEARYAASTLSCILHRLKQWVVSWAKGPETMPVILK
jgi:hypothetical protein